MEKKNPLTIRIPAPCEQSWLAMTPQGNGRFCGACSQTVIDFTNCTEKELFDFFSLQNTDRVCGRFRSDQLSHVNPTSGRGWRWIRSALALFLPFFLSTRVEAQRTDSIAQIKDREPENQRAGKWRLMMGKPILNRIEPVHPKKPMETEKIPQAKDRRKEEPGELNH